MGCRPPAELRHIRWHIIRSTVVIALGGAIERAEWSEEHDCWMRWGRCGDHPDLCQATYVGPAIDQESRGLIANAQWWLQFEAMWMLTYPALTGPGRVPGAMG